MVLEIVVEELSVDSGTGACTELFLELVNVVTTRLLEIPLYQLANKDDSVALQATFTLSLTFNLSSSFILCSFA